MSVSDKVNIQLEVTGGAVSAQEVDRVNKALQQMGVDATTASEVGKKLSANNKDVREGLQSLAIAASTVSPALGTMVSMLGRTKLATEGGTGVIKNITAALSSMWTLLTSPVGAAIAALGLFLGMLKSIETQMEKNKQRQQELTEEMTRFSQQAQQQAEGRQGAAQSEARDIGKIAGSIGAGVTEQNVEDIQRRAKLFQEAVPTATKEQALKAATVSITQGVDFNTARRGLAAQSFGAGVEIPSTLAPAGAAARMSLEASAARFTPAMQTTLATTNKLAPVSADESSIGAFSPDSDIEVQRAREVAKARFRGAQAAMDSGAAVNDPLTGRPIETEYRGEMSETGYAGTDMLVGAGEWAARKMGLGANPRRVRSQAEGPTFQNCIINNRNGEATGILGKPSESLTPIGGGG